MTDINLRILMSASQGNTMSVIGGIKNALDKGGLGGALAATGVAAAGLAVALGVESVNKAKDFQNAMLQNVAHAGLAKDQFNAVSQSVLQMSSDVGQMPTELAQGLYPILSGFSGITNQAAKAQTALEDLRLAAEDVAGTDTKTTVTSGALTAAFNALGLQTNNTATNISRLKTLNDEMEATVIAGNMHWDQYANVVGKLSTAIKGTGVSFQEASAGLATMTNEGFTAQRSQTYLANLFTQIGIKTDALAKNAAKLGGSYSYTTSSTKQLYDATHHLDGKLITIQGHIETLYKTHTKALGIGFDETKFKTMDLAQKIAYLTQITHGNQQELLKLLGGNATALKTFNALSTSLKTYQTNLEAIRNSQGDTKKAFDVASSSFQMAGQRMKATIDVLLIDLGTQLLPILTKLLDWVTPLIKQFANWVLTNQSLHQWLSNVGAYIQNTLIPTVVKIGQAVFNFVQWMQQGSGPALALKGALIGVGGIIAGMKVAQLAQDVGNLATKAMDFATNAGPKLLNILLGTRDAELAVGTNAKIAGDDIGGMGTASSVAAGEEGAAAGATTGMAGALLAAAPAILGVTFAASQLVSWIDSQKLPGQQMTIGQQAGILRGGTHGIAGGFLGWGQEPQPNSEVPKPPVNADQLPPWMYTPHGGGYPNPPHAASGGAVLHTGLAVIHQGEHITPAGQSGITINMTVNNPMRTRNDLVTLVDDIERELAQRFRSQTGNYATGGTF